MYRLFKTTYTLLAFASLALGFSGCSKDDPINIGAVKLQSNSTLGDILVDGNGKTLYFFAKDVNGQSQCTEGCLTAWPVYYAPNLKPGDGISADDFTVITRSDGAMQTAYKGRPLYYYTDDKAKGDVNGEAVGNVWYVAKPDYSLMIASAQLVGLDGKNYTSAYVEGTGVTRYFTDASGYTLYVFTHDSNNHNSFTTTDAVHNAKWPIFHVTLNHLPTGVNASDFGEITIVGGALQTTYKGWPLYYYGSDTSKGDTKGVSVGPGVWPIVNGDTAHAPS